MGKNQNILYEHDKLDEGFKLDFSQYKNRWESASPTRV